MIKLEKLKEVKGIININRINIIIYFGIWINVISWLDSFSKLVIVVV